MKQLIDYIDEQIENTERNIAAVQTSKENWNFKSIKLADYNDRLNKLKKIKTELEAWEVVKNKIFIKKGSIDYANINIKDWHHHLNKKEFETIEKALEVSDE